ncbi:hypothetical protein QJS04_geneDACA015003 [Acorus gramineus]|uniref:Proteasome-associated protein ECM29 homolog n=1 Tax=Acorus gramineus TaxID=55184 RepID=A0AAV9BVU2_ACOGR|nr:hypothetical protein QJS04_geneDACA015003 [Acorus gramineus]
MAEPSQSTAEIRTDDAEREEMLDRMLTRLALADDSNLQQLLTSLLPYTISSISSPSPSIRNSVMEILTHVNKRVKHQPEIGLPFTELWKIYSDANAALIVRNFCMVYIEMAFERMLAEDKMTLAPDLVVKVSELPLKHQDIVLRIVAKVIGDCHSIQIAENIARKYKAIGLGRDRQLFIEFCLHTILYQPPSQSSECPAGLSVAQSDHVTGKLPLKNELLLARKMGILTVIEAMDLAPELVYPLYIAACSDSQESVVKRGEELLKRKAAGVNLENSDLIGRLFFLFNGTVGTTNVAQELKVSPGSPALRARLMSVFCRSIIAANSFPSTLQCIFGCFYGNGTTSRLKQLGMEFTVWSRMDQLKLMGPVILSGIVRSLDDFLNSGIDQFLRLTIQESTNSLAVAYKDAPANVIKDLEMLLSEHCKALYVKEALSLQEEQSEVRFCAVREMALENLFPSRDRGHHSVDKNTDFKYPKLHDMLDYICKQQPLLLDSTEKWGDKLLFPSKMYVAMINFLLKCFEADFEQDGWTHEFHYVETLCELLERAMIFEGSVELHATASKALISIASCLPELVASRYARKISWARQLLGHVDSATRESASRLLGITCSAISAVEASALISDLVSSINGTQKLRFESYHGTLSAIGFVIAECMNGPPKISEEMFQSAINSLVDVVQSETATLASIAMEALGHIGLRARLPNLNCDSKPVAGDVLTILHEQLGKLLGGTDIKAIQKIIISLGHISMKETSSTCLNKALDLIFSLCRSKVEDVLFAAGEALSFIWGGVPVTADIILKSNYSSLSLTSNFLSGEVLSSSSTVMSTENDATVDSDDSVRDVIIKKLFDTLLFSSRKEERRAGTVWLLSLTMYCGRHPKIQMLLPEIQEAFSHLIGDQDDLTQELASQGMSIVYELGDSSMKQNLVNALVSTLTGSGKRKRAIKLMEDSEVFQAGSIGESLSGGKLSTYKELCGLANEMGQPDLIYKLMDLANYQAALNSKRGAAFGFSKIAKQAGDSLKPHLRLLVPRLLRYQYDPDKNVQDAMGHIWKSIVADPKKTIDEYFDLIIDDLLVQSGSRLWRSREASCLALADIIQGRKFDQVSQHLRRIWVAAFRAMDDIKETVRNSGDSLCRAVSSLTVRLCDISLTSASDASRTMDIVLPFLLLEGIVSKVDSVRKASVSIVMKLSKGAGTAIRPHLPDLVCCMLESLSSLEDQTLNYVELHASNVGIRTEKLENLRIAVAKDSPMWETLDLCLKVINSQSLGDLVPRLAQLVRSGVGLNTRVGVASFISLMVQKVNAEIKPFTTILLKLLFPAVLEERSATAKRAFASACAIVLKYAGPSQAQKLIEDTAALHVGDRNAQISCAILLKNYSSFAADVVSGYLAITVPVTFIARFEDDKDVSKVFEELWEENTSSERVTLQLYLAEIVLLLCDGVASSSWSNKKKSAKAIRNLSEVLGESLSSFQSDLLNCLLKEIPGRLWEGKDAILYATASLCTSCHKSIYAADPATPNTVLSAISSACAKKGKAYREAAFTCLQQGTLDIKKVMTAFGDPEFFGRVFPLLFEVCSQASVAKPGNASLINADTRSGEDHVEEDFSAPLDKVIDCVTSCIHLARVQDILGEGKSLVQIFSSTLSPGHSWTVKTSVFSSLGEFCSKFDVSDGTDIASQDAVLLIREMFSSVAPKVIECISSIKIAQVHIAASECLLDMTKLYKSIPPMEREAVVFKDELIHLSEVEKNEQAKSLLRGCINILDDVTTEGTTK